MAGEAQTAGAVDKVAMRNDAGMGYSGAIACSSSVWKRQ